MGANGGKLDSDTGRGSSSISSDISSSTDFPPTRKSRDSGLSSQDAITPCLDVDDINFLESQAVMKSSPPLNTNTKHTTALVHEYPKSCRETSSTHPGNDSCCSSFEKCSISFLQHKDGCQPSPVNQSHAPTSKGCFCFNPNEESSLLTQHKQSYSYCSLHGQTHDQHCPVTCLDHQCSANSDNGNSTPPTLQESPCCIMTQEKSIKTLMKPISNQEYAMTPLSSNLQRSCLPQQCKLQTSPVSEPCSYQPSIYERPLYKQMQNYQTPSQLYYKETVSVSPQPSNFQSMSTFHQSYNYHCSPSASSSHEPDPICDHHKPPLSIVSTKNSPISPPLSSQQLATAQVTFDHKQSLSPVPAAAHSTSLQPSHGHPNRPLSPTPSANQRQLSPPANQQLPSPQLTDKGAISSTLTSQQKPFSAGVHQKTQQTSIISNRQRSLSPSSNPQRSLSPPPNPQRPLSPPPNPQRPLSPPPNPQRPLSPPPNPQRPLSPPPNQQRPLSPPPNIERPLSPPPTNPQRPLSPLPNPQRPLSPPLSNLQRPLSPPPNPQRPISPSPTQERPLSSLPNPQRPLSPPPNTQRPLSPSTILQRPLSPPPSFQMSLSPTHHLQRPLLQTPNSQRPLSPPYHLQRPLSPPFTPERLSQPQYSNHHCPFSLLNANHQVPLATQPGLQSALSPVPQNHQTPLSPPPNHQKPPLPQTFNHHRTISSQAHHQQRLTALSSDNHRPISPLASTQHRAFSPTPSTPDRPISPESPMQHRPFSPQPCNHQRPLSPMPTYHRQNVSCPSSQQKAISSPHFGQDLSHLYPVVDNCKMTLPHALKQKSCLPQSLTSQRPLYVQHLTRGHLSPPPQDSLSSPSCSSSSSHLSADSHNLHCAHIAVPSQVHATLKCPPYKQSLQTNPECDDLSHSVNPEHCSYQTNKCQQCFPSCVKSHALCSSPQSEQQGSHAKYNALSLSDSSTDHSSTSASVFQPSLRHGHCELGAPDAVALRVRSGPLSTEWLPDVVMLRVLAYLPVESLCRSARVCRRWYWLVWDPRLWQTVQLGPWDEGSGLNVERALDALTARLCRDTPFVCLSLETLVLNGSPALGDAGLLTVARRCPELRRLEVSGCGEISNRGLLEVVTRCPNLEHLDVSDCPEITCVSLTPEASCQACPLHSRHLLLRHLDMSGCLGLTDEGLLAVARHCPRLARLYLRRCPGVADGGLRALARHCTALRELSLCDCPMVTDAGLREVAAVLGPRFRYLSLAHCERVTDITLRCLGRRCPGLRYLNARGCPGVTDRGLESLGRGCPRLRSLDVGRCPLVTDAGLEALARGCPGLKRLGLKGCESVSGRGLHAVALGCPGLQLLSVQDCSLSPDTLRFVQQHCRRCVIEHTNLGCV